MQTRFAWSRPVAGSVKELRTTEQTRPEFQSLTARVIVTKADEDLLSCVESPEDDQ